MNILDFLIGLTLVNGMPHFVLGVWKGRMLSGLGIGDTRNILYGILNFAISISLYLYQYGFDGLLGNGIYLGGIFVMVMYFILAKFFYKKYAR